MSPIIPSLPSHNMTAGTAPHILFGLADTQVEALATVVIACLTFFYMVVAAFQWWAMRAALKETRISNAATQRSNELAEKALIYGKRSWLIPEIELGSPFKGESDRWKVAFLVSNTGGVPGKIVNIVARVITKDEKLYELTRFGSEGAVIVPGGKGEDGGHRVEANVPAGIPDEEMLSPDGAPIKVSCAVTYKDVFTDGWETALGWVHGQDRKWYTDNYFDIVFK